MLFNFKALAALGLLLQSVAGAAVDTSLIESRATGYKNMAYYGSWYGNSPKLSDSLLTILAGACTAMMAKASSPRISSSRT